MHRPFFFADVKHDACVGLVFNWVEVAAFEISDTKYTENISSPVIIIIKNLSQRCILYSLRFPRLLH